ncbi:MAG: protein translocase subunit SecDF [Prevotellaceae bacterium]|jgi:SecD/SecF fusion protein|nr:protein translocase subunit SecDF [Prevotellaceae bacterium]
MQAKGFIKFVAVLCFLASIWMLSFTFVTRNVERQAREAATDSNGIVDEAKEAEILQTKRNEKVWLGYTYKECKDKELSLGLDLKGGMNVTMEISIPDVLKALSNQSNDQTFVKALEQAQIKQKSSTSDFITLFEESWNEIENEIKPEEKRTPMSRVFGTYDLRDRIKAESTNSEVIKVLNAETESAIANSFNVLRNRIDHFGVASPNIQRIGTSGRILVELPGIKEPERVRKLLQGTASLEFWETYENSEIIGMLQQANDVIKEIMDAEKKASEIINNASCPDSATYTGSDDSAARASATIDEDSLALDALADSLNIGADSLSMDNFPLFNIMTPAISQDGRPMKGPVIGYATTENMKKIDAWFELDRVRNLFPFEFKPMWTIKAIDKGETTYALIAIKSNRDGTPPLDGSVISDARVATSNRGGFSVSMDMNAEGANVWARLTADNLQKSIAIVLDGYVYSYPNVQTEIKGGSSEITGEFSSNEASDLANVLKSGKMPAPAKIVQEAVVGPSLGQQSINAGMISFVLAFILILIYMWFYYGQAGITSNIALITNVLLLFGAMASFGAVLTLPGIAGIVLTLGMAVDANIIIYERIKEELKAGNSMRIALKEGYKNAMSAIIDGQLTTLITGVILLILGTGPVKGFAVTLVVGIITSLATSIFISRLIFEWLLGKGKDISLGTKITLNFLENVHFDFLKHRKKAYILSAACIIIGIGFMFTKGMSYGIDFSGGRTYVVKFDQPVSITDVRTSVRNELDPSAEIKQYGPNSQLKITTKYKIDDSSEEVDKEILGKLYTSLKDFFEHKLEYSEFASTDTNPNGIISSETVGPTIATDMKVNAIIAVICALIAIFVYIAIRFSRWQFGLGGVVALTHDTAITLALFSIGAGLFPWTMDVDQSFIAAILTIIGYSINDTVVIFDRIRENRALYPKHSWYDNINSSISSTIVRTINTSATVLVVLLAIFILGGEVIRGFSFALMVGVAVGVYSTVFVAIPVAYDLIEINDKKNNEKIDANSKKNKAPVLKKK